VSGVASGSHRLFFVMLFNKADDRDDNMLKIRTTTKPEAERIAAAYVKASGNRFTLGKVITRRNLKKTQPEWHALLWGEMAMEE